MRGAITWDCITECYETHQSKLTQFWSADTTRLLPVDDGATPTLQHIDKHTQQVQQQQTKYNRSLLFYYVITIFCCIFFDLLKKTG